MRGVLMFTALIGNVVLFSALLMIGYTAIWRASVTHSPSYVDEGYEFDASKISSINEGERVGISDISQIGKAYRVSIDESNRIVTLRYYSKIVRASNAIVRFSITDTYKVTVRRGMLKLSKDGVVLSVELSEPSTTYKVDEHFCYEEGLFVCAASIFW